MPADATTPALHARNATLKSDRILESISARWEGVFDQKVIRDLADKYSKTPAQIGIRWHLDSGLVVI